ncbi:RNA-binding protein [Brevibacillus laterosporus]|uniref:RNA-binding protein n=1 Tax=Brevibacillus laterosporus TaxID=1465 RepID=UPI000E6BB143|nr:RNA-binding protein [Brevibacillus laterosporus]AYB38170.1 RNA-binding protein [Brevibacillus laterosporus]MBM7111547.1 30S ribosomal protein S1 [Brevibacillus laterosporus]
MSEQHIFWTNDPLEFVKQAKKSKEVLQAVVWKIETKDIPLRKEGETKIERREIVHLDLGGVKATCSDEEFSEHDFISLKGFVGHTVNVIVLDVIQGDSPDEFIVIVSRKKAETILAEEIKEKLQEGEILKDTLSGYNVNNNTLFINIGGIDAFCYLEDWDYVRIPDIRDAGTIGEPVTVMVKKVLQDPFIIRVSRKDAMKDPWENASVDYKEGTSVLGVISNVDSNYGIFVKLRRGVIILATVPNKSGLPKPLPGQTVSGVIKTINEHERRGKMIITGYPHGVVKRANPGSYLYE